MTIDGIPGPEIFRQRDVRRTPASSLSQSQTIVAPIGAILAWLKTFTNTPQTLPSGFVEANGQVLSDAESVYNGQTLPDLNGNNQFLRGNSTSGGTGGNATMAHTHTGPNHSHDESFAADGTSLIFDDSGAHGTGLSIVTDRTITTSASANELAAFKTKTSGTGNTGAASNTENRPPFYNVVWIMRIK